jgi:small subunit ribosomal protein S18
MQKKQCYFCTSNIKNIDYKDTELLVKFLTPQSRIIPRRKTGACAMHQRKLARTIKQAREMAVVPYTSR